MAELTDRSADERRNPGAWHAWRWDSPCWLIDAPHVPICVAYDRESTPVRQFYACQNCREFLGEQPPT